MSWQKLIFIALIVACLTPLVSPPIALALGLVVAFTFGNPFPAARGEGHEVSAPNLSGIARVRDEPFVGL